MNQPVTLDWKLLRGFPLPHHPDESDKEDRGRLLVIGGSRELPGAALLAGVAGLRAGAGKLQIATASSVAVPLGVAVPEARVIPYPETADGCIAESCIGDLLKIAVETQAVAIGCGLQPGPSLGALIEALLACGAQIQLILDAAALDGLSVHAAALRAWRGGALLLPHAGEMAKLLGLKKEAVEADPLSAARRAAEVFGAVTLLKGGDTHIVAPGGRTFRYEGGGVGLATSGSGDALAGIVGGLCARGADPLTAALWGVYLHGEAGRRLGAQVGRVGFLARELADLVPQLMEGRA